MEPKNDPPNDLKLSELLREWRVPDAPGSLDRRVLDVRRADSRRNWGRFLITGSIRIPVPVGLAIAALLLVMAGALALRRPTGSAASVDSISLVEFRPVKDVNVRMIRGDEAN